MATACPTPDEVLALLEGQLDEAQAAALERHVDGCAECRQLLAELVRLEPRDGRPPPTALVGLDAGPRPSEELPVGTRVAHWQLEGVLGRGGMGVVYAATDVERGIEAALKVLRRGSSDDPALRARFEREAQVMARLEHPHVVRVLETGEHAGFPWLAMERIDGPTLETWQQGRPWADVLDRYLEAGRALSAAHRAGVIHRDFKPSNVLIDARGSARLGDFGVAGEAGSTLTRTGQVLGTLAYLAPEAMDGEGFTPATDQFAFAVALWRGLYGGRPFAGSSAQALYDAVRRGPPPLPGRSAVPEAVGRTVQRALSADPRQRYASMAELIDTLETRARARSPVRPAALVAGAAVFGLTLGAGLWWLSPSRAPELERYVALARSGDSEAALRGARDAASGPSAGLAPGTRLERATHAAGLMLAVGAADEAEALLSVELDGGAGAPAAVRARAAATLARALVAQGRGADAARWRALALEGLGEGTAEAALARVELALERGEGVPAAVEALAARVTGSDLRLAVARLWQGEAALRGGAFEQAAAPLEQARAALEAALGPSHPAVARARSGLAEVRLTRGEVAAAERDARASLEVRAAALGEAHPELTREWSVLGWALARRGDTAAAQAAFEAAARLGAGASEVSWRSEEARAQLGGRLRSPRRAQLLGE